MKIALVYSGAAQQVDSQNASGQSESEQSADDQDTLVQLAEISQVLTALDYEVQPLNCGSSIATLEAALKKSTPDLVFNLVETLNGTDGLIYVVAGLFELLKLPYTGCSAQSLAMLASKVNQKKLFQLAGLPTAEFFSSDLESRSILPALANASWIVKSDSEHASVGMSSDSVVQSRDLAHLKIQQQQALCGGDWFAERFIDGREFNIGLLSSADGGFELLPPAEIVFENFPADKPKIVDYAAKWDCDSDVYAATVRSFNFSSSDQKLLNKLKALCAQCWQLFGLSGAARVDFRIDLDGNPWILEVNANPCLSSDAGFMVAAQRAGISATDVIRRLLANSIKTNRSQSNIAVNTR